MKTSAMVTTKLDRTTIEGHGKLTVSDTVKSHANDPHVLAKVAKAKEFLRKHPLPDRLLKK